MAKIGIACGGTGGHLYPGIAVAQILTAAGHEVRLYVSAKEIDRTILAGHPEFKSVVLPTIGWPGLGIRMIPFAFKLLEAIRLSRSELSKEGLSVVLGMGGFTSAPLLLTASGRKVPTLLHESNAIPGRVTRWMARRVSKVLLGFEACAQWLDGVKTAVTGTPVRNSLRRIDRTAALKYWGLDAGKFTIAVTGGSQGASGLNRMLIQALPYLEGLKEKVQFVHLAGPRESELLLANYRRSGLQAVVRPFCMEMEKLYSAADMVISRAGAASLTEISHFALPSILIPYPNASEDHQTRNAFVYVDTGAASVIAEGRDSQKKLAEEVLRLVKNEKARETMAAKAGSLNTEDAAERVAREVLDVI